MSARVVQLPKPKGEDVETAWAAYRGLRRAEQLEPALRDNAAHRRARERAEREFERLFEEWVKP